MPPFNISEYQGVDFTITSEKWSKYHLDDGSILKQKYVLTKVYAKKMDGNQYDIRLGAQKIVLAMKAFKFGDPSEPVRPSEYGKHIEQQNVRIVDQDVYWNEYEIDISEQSEVRRFILKVYSMIVMVHRTSLFNNDREPIYLTTNSDQVQVIPQQ